VTERADATGTLVLTRPVDALRLASALSVVLATLGLQLWILGAARFAEFAPGLACNACVVLVSWALCELYAQRARRAAWLVWSFYPLLGLFCLQIFAHTWFFEVAIERRLTLLDLSLGGLLHFFAVALPARGSLALVILLVASAGGAVFLARWLGAVPLRLALAVTGVLAAALAGLVLSSPRVTSPLFDGALELWQLASLPKVAPDPRAPAPALLAELDQSEHTRGVGPVRYKKVIVLVMETMTARNFERESKALPPDTFVQSAREHVQDHARYFPNNQDSRTGMLDMLFSRLVPYEAYDELGLTNYEKLVGQRSLVDAVHELGFSSAFAVSQTSLEQVVDELGWSELLHLKPADIAAAQSKRQLCFTPDEYEQSCEDLVLLPAVLDFVSRHERAFVYQEFIWGHAAEYNEASGKSNAAYYSGYVDALLRELAVRGLADDTLIALTSDHGFRDKGRQADPEVYRVPLWFYAPDLPARNVTGLFSHTDFGRLLFERLTPQVPPVADHGLVMMVGPTGQGNLFVVERGGGHVLLRHRAGLDLSIAQTGALVHSPSQLLALFQAYRARFAARLVPSVPP